MKTSIQLITISLVTAFTILMAGSSFARPLPINSEKGILKTVKYVSYLSSDCRQYLQGGIRWTTRCQATFTDLKGEKKGATYFFYPPFNSGGSKTHSFQVRNCSERVHLPYITISCTYTSKRIGPFSRR